MVISQGPAGQIQLLGAIVLDDDPLIREIPCTDNTDHAYLDGARSRRNRCRCQRGRAFHVVVAIIIKNDRPRHQGGHKHIDQEVINQSPP